MTWRCVAYRADAPRAPPSPRGLTRARAGAPQANHRNACSVCHEPYEIQHDITECDPPPPRRFARFANT